MMTARRRGKKYTETEHDAVSENVGEENQESVSAQSKTADTSAFDDDDSYSIQNESTFRNQENQSFLGRLSENLSVFKYLIIALFVPPFLNLGALQREANGVHFEGEKLDMGWGQKMYMHCKGNGLPTVILDSPTGATSDIWFFVLKELSEHTKVCTYDRSGLGHSDPIFHQVSEENLSAETRRFVGQPHTLDQMTSDLHHLITQAKPLRHPYILVSSDFSTLIARMYAINYPKEVSDIVLIDPFNENIFQQSQEWNEYWFSKLSPYYESLHLSAILGVSRMALLLGQLRPIYFRKLVPEELVAWQKSLLCNPRHMSAVRYEHIYMNASLAQMRDAWDVNQFPDNVSVTVMRREKPNEFPPHLLKAWQESQNDLIENLHPNCDHKIIQESDYLQLYTQPSLIVSTVQNLVTRWRGKYSHS